MDCTPVLHPKSETQEERETGDTGFLSGSFELGALPGHVSRNAGAGFAGGPGDFCWGLVRLIPEVPVPDMSQAVRVKWMSPQLLCQVPRWEL